MKGTNCTAAKNCGDCADDNETCFTCKDNTFTLAAGVCTSVRRRMTTVTTSMYFCAECSEGF